MRAVSVSVLALAVTWAACGGRDRAEHSRAGARLEPAATGDPAPYPARPRAGDPAPPEPVVAPPPAAPIAIDTHVDTTQRMLDDGDDIGERLDDGHLDIPRMREGGLTGAFFSVWVNPRRFSGDAAWERARALTGAIRAVAERHPDLAALCTTADEVRAAARDGKIALLIGVEGGHALGSSDPDVVMQRLREMYALGARYMTITWSTDNPLGHSSSGARPRRGLTPLGRRVIEEMGRLGMIVDVSHVSERTFFDIMDIVGGPVLASHSAARALSDHDRNLTDEQIRRVAQGGGAVCVNYFSNFIDADYLQRRRRLERQHAERFAAIADAQGDNWIARGAAQLALARELDPAIAPPTLETLGAHFAHVVEIGGPGAACLGSDFDGVPELPLGLDDVSRLGALREELERRELPVGAILGENVLRVLAAQHPAPGAQ